MLILDILCSWYLWKLLFSSLLGGSEIPPALHIPCWWQNSECGIAWPRGLASGSCLSFLCLSCLDHSFVLSELHFLGVPFKAGEMSWYWTLCLAIVWFRKKKKKEREKKMFNVTCFKWNINIPNCPWNEKSLRLGSRTHYPQTSDLQQWSCSTASLFGVWLPSLCSSQQLLAILQWISHLINQLGSTWRRSVFTVSKFWWKHACKGIRHAQKNLISFWLYSNSNQKAAYKKHGTAFA